jgi:hypothetical protein
MRGSKEGTKLLLPCSHRRASPLTIAARDGLTLRLTSDVERAEVVFFAILGWFEGHQRKGSGRKLLPDRQFVGCNCKPTEFEHEPTGLRYLSDLGPSDLWNGQLLPLYLQPGRPHAIF